MCSKKGPNFLLKNLTCFKSCYYMYLEVLILVYTSGTRVIGDVAKLPFLYVYSAAMYMFKAAHLFSLKLVTALSASICFALCFTCKALRLDYSVFGGLITLVGSFILS